MPKVKVIDESLIKKLVASIKCGVCGQPYESDSVSVLSQEEDSWFLRVSCPVCQTRCLVVAIIKEGKALEIITDLAEVEIDKFRNGTTLTADDVLDMHNLLKDFDGNFSRLFS